MVELTCTANDMSAFARDCGLRRPALSAGTRSAAYYDAMQEAIATGEPYRSELDPPDQRALPRSAVREGAPA